MLSVEFSDGKELFSLDAKIRWMNRKGDSLPFDMLLKTLSGMNHIRDRLQEEIRECYYAHSQCLKLVNKLLTAPYISDETFPLQLFRVLIKWSIEKEKKYNKFIRDIYRLIYGGS